jgi:hypothetical protein
MISFKSGHEVKGVEGTLNNNKGLKGGDPSTTNKGALGTGINYLSGDADGYKLTEAG